MEEQALQVETKKELKSEKRTPLNVPGSFGQAMLHHLNLEHLDLNALLQVCLHTGNEECWTEFIRRSQPVITGAIAQSMRRRGGRITRHQVDDLAQDTYLKLCANNFRALREFDCTHENALFGFLKVVACNVVHDYFRSCYCRKHGSGKNTVSLNEVDAVKTPTSRVRPEWYREILVHEITRALSARMLEPGFQRDCTIFWLYYRQGLSCNAIAQLACIGLSVKGVESTVHRLTKFVKQRLAPGTRQFARTTLANG